jgi:hypothetical protein
MQVCGYAGGEERGIVKWRERCKCLGRIPGEGSPKGN